MNLKSPNILDLTDKELVLLLNNGSETAFRLIFDKYWEELLQFATLKTGSIDTAKEIVQELFISIWERGKDLQINDLKPYLFTAAKYKIIKHLKQNLQTIPIEELSMDFQSLENDNLSYQELQSIISKIINTLPEKTQLIFYKSREETFTNKQISLDLNLSEKTVEYHIRKSLMALKLNLKGYITAVFFTISFFL